MSVSTKDLNKTLGKKDLFSVAVGQIIGAGIMALTGIAIGMTGRSVNISFMLAAIAVIFLALPIVFISSTVRLRGGQYTQAAVFVGRKFAGFFIVVFIFTNISIAMYAVSFAQYFIALVPGVPAKAVALILVTFIFIVNYFGVGKATKLQGLMVLVLALALALFVAFGIFEVKEGYFSQPGFMTNGIGGVLGAMALLTFATGGATVTLNLSAEAKNPKKDIPFVIIVSTLAVAALYAVMSTVAAGVLPVEEVANKPLNLVAEEIFPKSIYVFFVVGGAMFALVTTLNAQVSWITKPVMQACVDNWFPKKLAKLHPKYNTPYYLLGIYYIIGMLPIIVGLDIGQIANSSLFLNYVVAIILAVGALRLPKMFPEQWKKSPFKVGSKIYVVLIIICVSVLLLQLLLLLDGFDKLTLIGTLCILVLALFLGVLREKHVNMEVSVEDE